MTSLQELKTIKEEGHKAWDEYLRTGKVQTNPYDMETEADKYNAWQHGWNSNTNFGTL